MGNALRLERLRLDALGVDLESGGGVSYPSESDVAFPELMTADFRIWRISKSDSQAF